MKDRRLEVLKKVEDDNIRIAEENIKNSEKSGKPILDVMIVHEFARVMESSFTHFLKQKGIKNDIAIHYNYADMGEVAPVQPVNTKKVLSPEEMAALYKTIALQKQQ